IHTGVSVVIAPIFVKSEFDKAIAQGGIEGKFVGSGLVHFHVRSIPGVFGGVANKTPIGQGTAEAAVQPINIDFTGFKFFDKALGSSDTAPATIDSHFGRVHGASGCSVNQKGGTAIGLGLDAVKI